MGCVTVKMCFRQVIEVSPEIASLETHSNSAFLCSRLKAASNNLVATEQLSNKPKILPLKMSHNKGMYDEGIPAAE